jgi:hypothetical protein
VIAIASAVAQPANASTCQREADALRAHLVDEAQRASRWNVTWGLIYSAAVAGQLALALTETKPIGTFDRNYEELLYVGVAKAAIGVGSKLVLPLRLKVPAPDADPCADLLALRRAAARNARAESRSFYLNHFGGLAVNLAGVGVLAVRRNFATAAASFAVGFPVGLLATYTQPRGTWGYWRRARLRTGVTLSNDATTLWLAGDL